MIKEKELITIHTYINIYKDDYENIFNVEGDLNDDILLEAFDGIFLKTSFLTSISWNLSRPYTSSFTDLQQYIKFFFNVKPELDNEIEEIDMAIRFIEDQVDELKEDEESSNEEMSGHETEFENTAEEINDIVGDNNIPDIDKIPYGKEVKDVWKINYDQIEDDDERDEVEDLMYLLQDHYESYQTAKEENEEAESILEMAKENLKDAEEWAEAIQAYNYD